MKLWFPDNANVIKKKRSIFVWVKKIHIVSLLYTLFILFSSFSPFSSPLLNLNIHEDLEKKFRLISKNEKKRKKKETVVTTTQKN